MDIEIIANNYKLYLSDVSIAIYYANHDDFALLTYRTTLVLHVLMSPTYESNSICVKYLQPLFNGLCKIAKKYANSDDFGNYVRLFFKNNNLTYNETSENLFKVSEQSINEETVNTPTCLYRIEMQEKPYPAVKIFDVNMDDFNPEKPNNLFFRFFADTKEQEAAHLKMLPELFNELKNFVCDVHTKDTISEHAVQFLVDKYGIYPKKVDISSNLRCYDVINQIPNIYNEMENLRKVIKEELTKTDKDDVERIVRKEIEKSLNGSNKKLEEAILEIVRNALIQMHKSFWVRRSFWTKDIKNNKS